MIFSNPESRLLHCDVLGTQQKWYPFANSFAQLIWRTEILPIQCCNTSANYTLPQQEISSHLATIQIQPEPDFHCSIYLAQ